MKLSPLVAFAFSIVMALLIVFVIDPLDPTTFSTPFLLGLILMWLSLRQSAWVVLTVTLAYCIMDFYATDWFLRNFRHPAEHPYFWFFQRFGLFTVVSVMAVYLSYYRENSERNLSHVQSILRKIPSPMAISDATGYITYVNETLCHYFGKPAASLLGKRYVDLFMSQTQEGKAMRYYIELFGEQADTVHEVDLSLSVGAPSTKGHVICMGQGSQRSMITVFQIDAPALRESLTRSGN